MKIKIKQHDYVNLTVLLKGAVELNNYSSGVILGVDENGQLVTKAKVSNEQISSIEKWTDAFLIYSSIYLEAHPEQTQEILHYMFLIREAALKYSGTMWRTYDEQFRLRQAENFSPWSKINAYLWLRCFSGQALFNPVRPSGQMKSKSPPCIDFNKGFCKWVTCRYPHVCSLCYNERHGRWSCHMQPSQSETFRSFRQPNAFRGSYRGFQNARSFGRGQGRGSCRGQRQ